MKKLLAGFIVLLSFSSFATEQQSLDEICDLRVSKQKIKKKRFVDSDLSLWASSGDYASCNANYKCRNAGYSNCKIVEDSNDRSGYFGDGETYFSTSCKSVAVGEKFNGWKSENDIRDEKCEKIAVCAVNKRIAESRELSDELYDLNRIYSCDY